jgi:myxalamid-type nonribosomal peptide synthetase MxaA
VSTSEDSKAVGQQPVSADRARLLELLVQKRLSKRRQLQPRRRSSADSQVPLSWAQQRLWFIDQLEGGGAAYNLPIAMRLRGILDRRALCRTLDMLIARHETLRTVITDAAGDAHQDIAPSGQFVLKQFSVSDCDSAQREQHVRKHQLEEAQDLFDLRTGPLIRGRLLELAADEHVLMITMHHIISDGWSVGVLLHELAELYNAQRESREPTLAPLPVQYGDYVLWQRECL